MESYLDFFEKTVKASPWLDTDLNTKRFYEPDLTTNPDSPFIATAPVNSCAALTGWIWMIGRL
jgi:hypothetical protein